MDRLLVIGIQLFKIHLKESGKERLLPVLFILFFKTIFFLFYIPIPLRPLLLLLQPHCPSTPQGGSEALITED